MQVYGLIGSPVGHSLSPPMHEAAYEALGMDATYVTLEPDRDRVGQAVVGADALGLAGLNVTIPFKQTVLTHVHTTETAERVGAVNTVVYTNAPAGVDGGENLVGGREEHAGGTGDGSEGGTPVGHNTDVEGVRRALGHHGVSIDGADAVVVGAGGAGRAATYALADGGASVHVANRTTDRATGLADDFADLGVSAGGLDSLESAVPEADVLVNATSVGMEAPEETPVDAELLHGDLAVLDAVYTPLETRLLEDAAEAGATTVDGAWMLLFQGAAAFEHWTGRDAPVEAMNDALRAEL